ncbi:cation diffusion facilitator family transporter [Enterovirga aerilata]|uniref:Cation transporter n=1 Tax=Enterovirga aerilata TaxID=2730920 RepID=A0A849I4V0_9HYPH|nr:cation diffusion facilitator family transporter [Enterovirga sp. DB1703]NNM74866.1 cation transporter [Enterovirga sp. DB1703]
MADRASPRDHAPHDHRHDHAPGHEHGHPAHDHHHHGGLGHVHAPASFGRAFAIGISLNVGIVILQAVYGYLSNSVALIADAGHNLSDVLGLVVAWAATVLAARPPSSRFTYGLRGSSILGAMFNAVFLLVAVGALSWEAVGRLVEPEPVAGITVIVVAAIGMVLNGFTAWLFAGGGKSDLNIRGAYLHMAADAAVSAGVVVAGFVILTTGWLWLDPAVSLVINAIIVWGTWSLLRESLVMSLAAVPAGIDPEEVRAFLAAQPGVAELHDLHIWPISTTETALTAHLAMPGGHPGDGFLMRLAAELNARFRIGHVTLQVETDPATVCALAPAHVV